MNEYPVFSLDAVLHDDLASVTSVVNIYDIEHFLWVKVDPVIAQNYRLYELDEVGVDPSCDLDIIKFCTHENNRIWYRFSSEILNQDPGQHVYRMHMVNIENETTISLYFSYILQRENAEKPYVYMKDTALDGAES